MNDTSITPDAVTRTLLAVVLVILLSASVVGPVNAQRTHDRIVLRQDGQCYPLQPLGNGSQTVAQFYDYRNPYNMNRSDPLYSSGYKYSSFGTTDLQRNETSQLFLYNGSDGLSLVFLHGRVYGDSEEGIGGGGTVEMNITGLPPSGYWAVQDDTYPGQRQLEISPTHTHAVWTSKGGRTDGGAFVGLNRSGWNRIEIQPRFNERSPEYPSSEWKGSPESNEYTSWIVRSGARTTHELDMTSPVFIESGSCSR